MQETLKKRDAVLEKYENVSHPSGLDTDPSSEELKEITEWFGKEVESDIFQIHNNHPLAYQKITRPTTSSIALEFTDTLF